MRFAGLFLLLLAPPVFPLAAQLGRELPTQQGQDYYIEGNVLGADEKPVAGARVVLSTFGSEMGQTVVTDGDGRFAFYGLGRASYQLRISGVGYQEHIESLTLAGGSQNLRIQLKGRGKADHKTAAPVVTAADLSVPPKAREHYEKGLERLAQKAYKAAGEQFEEAVKLHPPYAAAHGALGIAYLQQHRGEEAAQVFRKTLELNASSYDAHVGMGILLNDQRKWADATGHLLKARELKLDAWQVHYELGRAYSGMERFPEAEASLKQARTQAPDFPNLSVQLLNAFVLQGKYPEAIAEMKYFLKRWPEGKTADQVRQKLELLEKEVAGK